MKLVMTLLASTEVDTVHENVAHHLWAGVDHIIATTNRAPAEIVDALRAYESLGWLTLLDEPSDVFSQEDWVTRMARMAARELRADWVINCDADEFWWPQAGSLGDVLSAVPERYGQLKVRSYDFLPTRRGSPYFYEDMVAREREARYGKSLHRGHEGVSIGHGNHSVGGTDQIRMPAWDALRVLHFPVRSYAQYEAKVVTGATAVERNPDAAATVSPHWVADYRLHESGGLEAKYDALLVDSEAVAAGAQSEELVIDERLRQSLRALRTGTKEMPYALPSRDREGGDARSGLSLALEREAATLGRLEDSETARRLAEREAKAMGAEAKRLRRELREERGKRPRVRDVVRGLGNRSG